MNHKKILKKYQNKVQIFLLCIGTVVLSLFIHNSGIMENYEIFFSVNIPIFVLAFLCTPAVLVLRIYRWKYLSQCYGNEISWKDSLLVTLSSLFFSNITPAKFGDLYKAYFMKKAHSMTLIDGISMLFYERFFELIILFFASLAVIFINLSGMTVIVLETIAIIILSLLFFYYKVEWIITIFNKIMSRIHYLQEIPIEIHIRKLPFFRIMVVFCITLFSMSLEFLQLWLVAFAFGYILNPILVTVFFSLSIIAGLVSHIPLSLGVMEGSLSYFLGFLGINSVDSMAIVLSDRLISMYFVLILGFVFSKLSLDRIQEVHS
ncbi:MAG: lysylphosphatidylglycerol synthase transmembrane domain-containing protein [Methanoculleaceae archaeon]